MHPDVGKAIAAQKASRDEAKQCVLWMGVGLEAAAKHGALPKELTASQKAERPRAKQLKRVEVVADEAWHVEQRQCHLTSGAHPSHALQKAGPFFFCARCGCHGSKRLASLAAPCEMQATPSRRYLLKKLLEGRHPRTGEPLGEVERATASSAGPFSASSRRR